jgi:hypothetical protein
MQVESVVSEQQRAELKLRRREAIAAPRYTGIGTNRVVEVPSIEDREKIDHEAVIRKFAMNCIRGA